MAGAVPREMLDALTRVKLPGGVRHLVSDETLDIEVLTKVRHCANTGLVLGTASFREQVQRLRN